MLNLKWKRTGLFINMGWYRGDPFKIISLTAGEILRDFKDEEIDQVTMLNFQFLKFVFAFGWQA